MDILLTFIFIALLVFVMTRKVHISTGLFFTAMIMLVIYTLVYGKSIMGDSTSGSAWIDIFEYTKSMFVTTFSTLGLTIIPIVAFSTYMNHIGATRLLVIKAIKPFKNTKNPYFLCVIATIIGAVLKMVLPSQVGLMALLFITAYPIMVGAGMSKLSAGAACVLGTAFDWGPACPMTAMIVAATGIPSQTAFFFKYCLWTFPIAIVVAGIVSMIVNKTSDAKAGFVIGSDTTEGAEEVQLPSFYALLPHLPLVIVIVFSDAVIKSVSVSPFAAVMITFTLTFVIEMIRKKDLVSVFSDTGQLWTGMGKAFGDFITMNACASLFAGALTAFGGVQHLATIVLSLKLPGILLILVFLIIYVLMSMVCGNSVPANSTFAPMIPGIAQAAGSTTEKVAAQALIAQGFSRSMTPISGIMIMMQQFMGINVLAIIKRNLLPFLAGFVVFFALIQICF